MAPGPVVIELTEEQQALIRGASGKNVGRLYIEPLDTGSGWLCSAKGKEFWLLKDADPESYLAARRVQQAQIDAQYARFRLRVMGSSIHHLGVFAEEQIPARRNVIEYTGELVNPIESFRRAKDARATYIFKLDEFWRIDGSVGGSGAEYINHSCDPNLRCRRLRGGILLQSLRPIAAGEELTLDYHFSPNSPTVRCQCGSPKCRGTINLLKEDKPE